MVSRTTDTTAANRGCASTPRSITLATANTSQIHQMMTGAVSRNTSRPPSGDACRARQNPGQRLRAGLTLAEAWIVAPEPGPGLGLVMFVGWGRAAGSAGEPADGPGEAGGKDNGTSSSQGGGKRRARTTREPELRRFPALRRRPAPRPL